MEWRIGDRLEGRWEIHKILQGGMGVVYVVHDHEWNEALAAKTFQDAVFERNPQTKPLFVHEALAWVQLDMHPHIAQALFVQEIEGKPVLFLEYVSGGDLSAWIGTPRLTEDLAQVLRLSVQFCDGMIHARAKGVDVHRDIKPQNCLLTESGDLKVTDFGLAKVLAIRDDVRGAAGTVTHMPPEQFDDAAKVGVTADVYSFGVMLYQMVTGRLPFRGSSREDFARAHRSEPPPVEELRPPGIRMVVERCLAKKPEDRWQDFAALRVPLAQMYEGLTGKPAPSVNAAHGLDVRQWLNKGVSLAALGLRGQAMNCYEQALAIDPAYGEVWSNKGNILREEGRLQEAVDCYDRAIAGNPELELAWYNKGAVLEMLGRPQEALDCLERALTLDPHLARAWSSRGVALDKLGRQAESMESYRRAVAIDPRLTAVWTNYGNQLRNLGRLNEALECHERALGLQTNLPECWYNQANVLADLRRHEEAIASYERALEIREDYGPAWAGKGNVYLNLGVLNKALLCYERALAVDGAQAATWFNKATVLKKLGRKEEALEAYDQALDRNGRDEEAWIQKGGLLDAMGREHEGYACYITALSINPENAIAWHNRGVAARAMKRPEEALQCHSRAVELDPKMDEAWLGKANLLADLGRSEEALATYDHALALNPKFVSGWFSKGATLGNAERYEEALQCFEKAEELGHPKAAAAAAQCRKELGKGPEAPDLTAEQWHNVGADMAEEGKYTEALICFEKAIEKSPGAVEPWYAKAIVMNKLGRQQESLECYEKTISLQPGYAPAWFSKGVILSTEFGQHAEALASFEKAKALGYPADEAIARCQQRMAGPKEDAAALHVQGAELDGQNRPAEALECFERALAVGPEMAETWFGKGVVLGKLNRREEEVAAYDRTIAIAPEYAPAWYAKARTLGGYLQRYAEALPCFERAMALGHPQAAQGADICRKALAEMAAPPPVVNAEGADTWHKRGYEIVASGGNQEEALYCFERALAMNPGLPESWWGKGVALGNLGRVEESLRAYDCAIGANPALPGPWISKGAALYQAARYQEAIPCYEKARELGDLTAWQGVFMCRQALGQTARGG